MDRDKHKPYEESIKGLRSGIKEKRAELKDGSFEAELLRVQNETNNLLGQLLLKIDELLQEARLLRRITE